jgi:hypothetical protein
MVLGMFYGAWIGIAIGLAIGSFVFRAAVKQRSFARLDYSADFDDEIPEPSTGGHVSKKLKTVMGFTDEWVRMPDYQRLVWMNHVIKTMWPHIGKVVFKQAVEQAKPILDDICTKVPMGILESIDLEVIDLGEAPVRLGGMKVYDTREDNLIMEAPLIFGSGLRVRVSAKLRVPGTGYAVYFPVEVSNVQLRAVSRITLSPIVETLPCVGGVSISLLKAPYFDASFSMISGLDIMALPFVHEAIKIGTKTVMEMMLVYPNKMDFPIMEDFGIAPPPLGMLEITILKAEGLPNSDLIGKSDPYCEVSIREGRVVRTRTIDNNLNPTWDQTFSLLVDDPGSQSLTLVVKDDDLGFEDDVLGAVELPLDEAEFIIKPRETIPLKLQLQEADSGGFISDFKGAARVGPGMIKKAKPRMPGSKKKRQEKKAKKAELGKYGTLWIEATFHPFVSPEKQEEAAKKLEESRRKALEVGKMQRSKTKGVTDARGVLTVNVIRAKNLEYKETNEVDPYVRLTLFDATTGGTEAFRTSTQMNDASPRWGEKFDFINVPATSFLTATIYDRSSMIESRLSMTPWKSKPDKSLGHVRIPVEEVARNKAMKDEWPLLEADKGDIQLSLAFQPIIFDDGEEDDMQMGGLAPGDEGAVDVSGPADRISGNVDTSGSGNLDDIRRDSGPGKSAQGSGPSAIAAKRTSSANPPGRKAPGFIDDKGRGTQQDLSEGTMIYGGVPNS